MEKNILDNHVVMGFNFLINILKVESLKSIIRIDKKALTAGVY